ncbi:glutamine--fructose-6-phosphate transaminase [Haloarcula vallismortis]|uniref:Glucosamine--fructose-6-phosphate aminotransferase n=2 Tax=Haloarcula vallismortis TaxID=28442 RepID=M0J7I2_HALVA|nr:SIS domain-containing protein [Haloarcula vallismortis]EMA05082.1 glucosamine--fructose-6-phosphate aminotransferase [Haloarcula vallismortis ATCC 29715]SDX13098.1 glutamine--fructose-6-phosphate transaminase [Haloarcula vallismortis]
MTTHAVYNEIRSGIDQLHDFELSPDAISEPRMRIADADRVHFIGCGSSYWTGVIGQYAAFQSDIDATAYAASEYLFAGPPITERTAVIAYSQSGETTETVTAARRAKDCGAIVIGITNSEESTLGSVVDEVLVTPAGTEKAVLATKTVDAALMLTFSLLESRHSEHPPSELQRTCRTVIDQDFQAAVGVLAEAETLYTLGQGIEYGLAGEAATKFGEGALLHTTPLPTPEISHGPIANAAGEPALVIATQESKSSLTSEVVSKLRDARVTTIVLKRPASDYDGDISIELPTHSPDHPIVPLKILQSLTYKTAVKKGYNPDDPPELSKHVEWSALG